MSNRIGLFTIVLAALFASRMASAATLHVETVGSTTTLRVDNAPPNDPPFYSTQSTVTQATLIQVPASTMLLVHWRETPPGGSPSAFYAFSYDGHVFAYTRQTDYLLPLLFAQFDPLVSIPPLPTSLQADATNKMHIVQFFTQPLEQLKTGVTNAGGIIRATLPSNADIVEMTDAVRATVAALPYVRWVGPYHPGYRLENYLRDNWAQGQTLFPLENYNVAVFESGPAQKNTVAARIQTIGGTANAVPAEGILLIATLTHSQLQQLIRWDEVAFVERSTPAESDMDLARRISGAPVIEARTGYSGEGVRGEVMDSHLKLDHPAFRGACVGGSSPGSSCWMDSQCSGGTCDGATLVHGADGPSQEEHGTSVHGCLFGDGTGAPTMGAKGMIPDAQAIFATRCRLLNEMYDNYLAGECPNFGSRTRQTHTRELVEDYQAVFQTNSWGNFWTSQYGSYSYNIDDAAYSNDLIICQSQANCGAGCPVSNPCCSFTFGSRPQAWAKNVVSVGSINHKGTLGKDDDLWASAPGFSSASAGPAADGRIKPDLVHFNDKIETTNDKLQGYTPSFGGTSAATPITCGNFGLFFQMWHEGVFNNGVPVGASVFDGRPHASTAKAMLINTAEQYIITSPTDDKRRSHQGWGLPSAGKLYKLRNNFPVIVNETTVLTPSTKATHNVSVASDIYSLKATLVYADPPGTIPDVRHAINDLDLKVTAPDGTTLYWGNNGLRDGNWSVSGGISDTDAIDTVENVFVQNPAPGTWQVEVRADVINQNTALGGVDFALVVSLDRNCNAYTGNTRSDAEDVSLGLAGGGSEDYDDNGVPDECQKLYHVNPSGNGQDGLFWTTAFTTLQTAIDAAQLGDRIMVKAGDYGPVTLKNGVAVYGGFAGVESETSPSHANYRVNVTNIVGNGSSPHVVSSINNGPGTILRGVYIKNGNANGSTGNDAHGGGLYLENSNAKFVQCLFTNNDAAGNGAAAANMKNAGGTAGNPTFVNCIFHRNKDVNLSGEILKGGAVYSEAGNPQFVNCLFHKNEGRNGGAIYIQAGQPNFLNCTISDNLANKNGGGIYNNTGQPTLRNSIVYFNDGGLAGPQIHNPGSGTITATYTDVQGGWTGQGNISDLPQFTDRFADNYTLLGTSPCPDAGRNSDLPADPSDIDWDGNITEQLPNDLAAPLSGPLPADLRIGNCVVGMGAFELQGLCSAP